MGANTEKEVADGARVADQWEPLRGVWLAGTGVGGVGGVGRRQSEGRELGDLGLEI